MTPGLYRTLTTVAGPLIGFYLRRRLAAGKEDPERFAERFGRAGAERPPGPLVWLHGASVGESLSMIPLIDRLLAHDAALHALVTTGTVTSARLMAERLPGRALHQFVPVDRPDAVRRFLEHWRPDLALWAESEFWPNLIGEAAARGVPLILVNARMSDASFARWRRFRGLIAPLLAGFEVCFAQGAREAGMLTALGAREVRLAGNLKAAAPPLPADEAELARLRTAIGARPLWLAASTHPGEEEMIASVHRALAPAHRRLLTIVVPRHPDRGAAVAEKMRAAGLEVARRAAGEPPGVGIDVYVADTLGELGLFYRLAPVAFVGGSLVPHGGHNPLEPARLGCAVLHGPHMFNFATDVAAFVRNGAEAAVADADALGGAVGALLADGARRERCAAGARAAAEAEAAVLDAIETAAAPFLAAARPPEPAHACA